MRAITTIFVVYLAAAIALPGLWCRALPVCPLPCCHITTPAAPSDRAVSDLVHDQHCGHASGCCCDPVPQVPDGPRQQNCQCADQDVVAKIEKSQPAITVLSVAFCELIETRRPALPREFSPSLQIRDFQKLLCRWTC